jgi:hypothetical protein
MTKPQFHRYVEWVTVHGAFVFRQAGLHQLTFDFDTTEKGHMRAAILRFCETRQAVIFESTWGDEIPGVDGPISRLGFDAVLLFEDLLQTRFPWAPTDFSAQMGPELLLDA